MYGVAPLLLRGCFTYAYQCQTWLPSPCLLVLELCMLVCHSSLRCLPASHTVHSVVASYMMYLLLHGVP